MQLMSKSEICSRPSNKSCRYSTCPTVILTNLRRSDEWNFEPWICNALRHHRTWSTLVQVMAPSPEPDQSSVWSFGIQLRAVSQEKLKIYIIDTNLKISNSKLQPYPTVANELIKSPWYTGDDFMFFTGLYAAAAATGCRLLFTQ